MTTYYVRTDGSNANAGTGAAAASAWQTITKALGATGIASGDTLYIAPGIYRETVQVAMTSATVATFVLGDPGAVQFTDLQPGPVVISPYTSGDTATPATVSTFNMNGRDYLNIENIFFLGANFFSGSCLATGSAGASTNFVIRRCTFHGHNTKSTVQFQTDANVSINGVFEENVVLGSGACLNLLVAPHTSAYDINLTIQNCLLITGGSAAVINIGLTSAGSNPGGVDVLACTLIGGQAIVTGTGMSTTIPCTIQSCVIVCNTGLNAATAGQITEDFNWINAGTLRANVTAGANSKTMDTQAMLFDFGWSWLMGFHGRPFMTPMTGSAALGFGGSAPSVDLLNRPRPAGSSSTAKGIGALERHDSAGKETTTTDAGGVAIVITGPGDHDFQIPVAAALTSITVRARYDTTHGTTNKPQAILLANAAIGVSTATQTMTAAVDTWETLTFTAFTPSAAGVVTVRLTSRPSSSGGKAFFDTFSVT